MDQPAEGVRIELFDKGRHDRAAFASGEPALDGYLKQRAGQDIRRYLASMYVACPASDDQIIGYVTLSNAVIDINSLPPSTKLPYAVLPASLIGRLAVDLRWQGHGLGRRLLMHALAACLEQSYSIGSAFVLVDAKDEAARGYYEQFGFVCFEDAPLKLYLPMATVRQLTPL